MPDPTPTLRLPPTQQPEGEPICHAMAAWVAVVFALSGPDWQPHPCPNQRTPSCPAAQAPPAPAPACRVQPSTPAGSASSHTGQHADISTCEGAHAGDAERSKTVPLLAAGTGRPALGLRRRQVHQGS